MTEPDIAVKVSDWLELVSYDLCCLFILFAFFIKNEMMLFVGSHHMTYKSKLVFHYIITEDSTVF